jgi:hypothetical protein
MLLAFVLPPEHLVIETMAIIIVVSEIEAVLGTFFNYSNLSLALVPISLQNAIKSFVTIAFVEVGVCGMCSMVISKSWLGLLNLLLRILISYFFISVAYVFALKVKKRFKMPLYLTIGSTYMAVSFALMRVFSYNWMLGVGTYLVLAIILGLQIPRIVSMVDYEKVIYSDV